jgi:archaellin
LLSAEKERQTVEAGMEETSANLTLRGGVLAVGNGVRTGIDTIKFYLTPVLEAGGSTGLSSTGVVVTYTDSANSLNCTTDGSGSCSWTANWVIGSGDLVDPGERVEMIVTLSSLTPLLTKNMEFTIQVRPNKGAVVVVNKTIPGEVKEVMELY